MGTFYLPTATDAARLKADHSTLKGRPRVHGLPAKRPRYRTGGGAAEVSGEVNLVFGVITATLNAAIGYEKESWGSGEFQRKDLNGDNFGDPVTIYNRYFEKYAVNIPVHALEVGELFILVTPGCSKGPAI